MLGQNLLPAQFIGAGGSQLSLLVLVIGPGPSVVKGKEQLTLIYSGQDSTRAITVSESDCSSRNSEKKGLGLKTWLLRTEGRMKMME